MGKFNELETKYFGMDSEALQMCEDLDDAQRLAFFDQWRTDCFNLRTDNCTMPEYPTTVCGLLNRIAWKTAKYVYDTYMKRKSGGKKNPNPDIENGTLGNGGAMVSNGGAMQDNDTQSNKHQSELTIKQDIINQIKSELIPKGYSTKEIECVSNSVDDWNGIANPIGYVRRSIDNNRKNPPKLPTVPAQRYTQRDYSDEDAEARRRMLASIAEVE